MACLVVGFTYLKKHQPNWDSLSWHPQALLIVLVLPLLAVVNWGLEAHKWRLLISTLQPLSFIQSVKATLSGVAVSFVTPFRVGDFLGRVLHLQNNKRKATFLTFYGNFSQLTTTLLFGLSGLSLLQVNGPPYLRSDMFVLLIVLGWVMFALFVVLVFWPTGPIQSFKLIDLTTVRQALESITLPLAGQVLSLSILRYLIFLLQYVLCFYLLGSEIDPATLAPMITLLYLLITFVPSPVLGKLGVRESVSLFLLGPYEDTAIVLSASLLIWLINLFIPSIIGAGFLLRARTSKDHE